MSAEHVQPPRVLMILQMTARVPISAADVARLLESMGVDRVVAIDLHCGQIQGFFGPRVPVDNLEAQQVGVDYFSKKKLHNAVVVSPDAGGVYRAKKFREQLAAAGVEDPGTLLAVWTCSPTIRSVSSADTGLSRNTQFRETPYLRLCSTCPALIIGGR